jgi:hypothetical protein
MNECAREKLTEFEPFFGPAAQHTHIVPAIGFHAYCDNCTDNCDDRDVVKLANSNMLLCAPCFRAIEKLRLPLDIEKCRKIFNVHPGALRLERVRAHIAWFNIKSTRNK